jgi:hypothetical protein
MKVKQQRHVSAEAETAFLRALRYSCLTVDDVREVLSGYGWCVWNCGNLAWVLTKVTGEGDVEVLLAGGSRARECVGPWERAMIEEPAHKGRSIFIDGRRGWSRLLPHWERRDDVLYLRVE